MWKTWKRLLRTTILDKKGVRDATYHFLFLFKMKFSSCQEVIIICICRDVFLHCDKSLMSKHLMTCMEGTECSWNFQQQCVCSKYDSCVITFVSIPFLVSVIHLPALILVSQSAHKDACDKGDYSYTVSKINKIVLIMLPKCLNKGKKVQ